MYKVVMMVEVEDLVKAQEGFRTHADLFRSLTITKPIHFGTIGGNQIAACFEPDDEAVFVKGMESQAAADAMEVDGVKRETVKVFVLDKTFEVCTASA
jgi:hypothetical protein